MQKLNNLHSGRAWEFRKIQA